jgi:multiple sugar transport system substrate-binding protein
MRFCALLLLLSWASFLASRPYVLSVWGLPPSGDAQERGLFLEAVGEFEKSALAGTGGSVRVHAIERNFQQQQFVSVMAGGKGPDVAVVWAGALRTLAPLGILASLDEEIRQSSRFAFMNAALFEPSRIQGRTYGVPHDSYFQCLLIRKASYQKAGFDPAKPPATWAELEAAAIKMNLSGSQAGFGFVPKADQFLDYLWQAGGEILRWDQGRTLCAFQENPGLAALSFLHRLRHQQKVMQPNPLASSDEMAQLFAMGRVAMINAAPDLLHDLVLRYGMKHEDVIIAPLPAGPSGLRASHLGGGFYVVNAQVSPELKKVAFAFITHMLSPETQLKRWRGMQAMGMPIVPGAFSVDVQIDHPSLSMVKEGLQYLRAEPYHPNWPQMKDIIETAVLEKAMIDPHADLAAVLADAAQQVQTSLLDE